MSGLLQDRVAIVTGGARGIGRAIAQAFVAEGAKLVLADTGVSISGEPDDPAAVQAAAAALGALPFAEDISAAGAAEQLTQLARERFGAVDIVVNNAAILRDAFIFKGRREDFERVLAVNLSAAHALLTATTPLMREQVKQGRAPGRIVNIVSSAGLIGNFGQSAYAASKAGLFALTRVVAMDMARTKVACNAIAPFAATRVTESIQPANEEQAQYKARALKVSPEAVARLAVFLASNTHEFTGQLFGVRGRELFVFSQPRPVARAELPAGQPWDAPALRRIIDRELAGALADLKTDLELFNTEPLT
jgi:NAD(P)-dependent dehydrogenase (short-subunit alcohol dehydrogenase family)